MIVDSSALIAILRREPEAERFVQLLLGSEARVSAGTLIETRAVLERFDANPELDELMQTADIKVVAVDERQAGLAYDGFRRFGKGRHPAALNLGNLFAYAAARALRAPILCKGDDFRLTDVETVE
jgi:ribonuclease VapC